MTISRHDTESAAKHAYVYSLLINTGRTGAAPGLIKRDNNMESHRHGGTSLCLVPVECIHPTLIHTVGTPLGPGQARVGGKKHDQKKEVAPLLGVTGSLAST